ncbi:MAG: UvrD-helicase domain-containing protein [Alistipes sp.]|nr:UvrD-helicase domain-containing protein [Candidatus Alistipes equi]
MPQEQMYDLPHILKKMSNISQLLETLSLAQREAVVNFEGPSLIIAGAGSGKTRVLTSRIAYMASQGVAPENIIALTFTNKAAREMRERIHSTIGEKSRYLNMGTFHSIFARILRQNAAVIGFPENFTIYDTSDQRTTISAILKDMNIDATADQYKPAKIISRISLAKNALLTPAMYEANNELLIQDMKEHRQEFHNIYKEYCLRCKRSAAMDFDDLLLRTNILLRTHSDILRQYQEQFRYILVDEYQDTNIAQYMIIRQLGQRYRNICVVGDDSQSIYAFRGANIDNILSFKNDWPGCREYKLEENYRSTQTIVDAANSLISHNPNRLDKECFSSGEKGEKIHIVEAYTEKDEALTVVDEIRKKVLGEKGSFNDVAVLYRNHSQSRPLEEAMHRFSIPYVIHKGSSFYERKEIKNIMAYFRLITNSKDDEALKRIINFPARGIGETTMEKIEEFAKREKISIEETIIRIVNAHEKSAIQTKLKPFITLIHELRAKKDAMEMYKFGLEVATRSGIISLYSSEKNEENKEALENVMELLNSITAFEESFEQEADDDTHPTFDKWLESAILSSEQNHLSDENDSRGRVTLMTVHASKGLEYKYVYIVGCGKGIFPSRMTLMDARQIEEERRLFYVAMTRAEKNITISYSRNVILWGKSETCEISPFVKDIDTSFRDKDFHNFDKIEQSDKQLYDFKKNPQERPHTPSSTTYSSDLASRKLRKLDSLANKSAAKKPSQFKKGEHVLHDKYGEGVINEITRTENGIILCINFRNVGTKNILEHLCHLSKL